MFLQMAVVANEDGDLMMQDPLGQDSGIVTEVGENGEEDEIVMSELKVEDGIQSASKSSGQTSRADPGLRKEMETCFGFDEVRLRRFFFFNCNFFKLYFYAVRWYIQIKWGFSIVQDEEEDEEDGSEMRLLQTIS